MTKENTFTYKGGTWCRKCRAQSRKRSVVKNEIAAKKATREAKRATNAAIKSATGKAAKAIGATPVKPKAKTGGRAKPSTVIATFETVKPKAKGKGKAKTSSRKRAA